jgi:hypothetical protein
VVARAGNPVVAAAGEEVAMGEEVATGAVAVDGTRGRGE